MACNWCGDGTDMAGVCETCMPPLTLCKACCMHKDSDGYFAQPPPKIGMRSYVAPVIQAPDTNYAAPSSAWSDDAWRTWNAFNNYRSEAARPGPYWRAAPSWDDDEHRSAAMWTADNSTSASSSAPAPSLTWSNRLDPDTWYQGAFSSQSRWDNR